MPLFLVALSAARGAPALLYRRELGREGHYGAGLLEATSLPFIVTATEVGAAIGAIGAATDAALVTAGLLSVVVFPPIALARLRRVAAPSGDAGAPVPPLERLAHRPMGTQY
ncbi:MAG: hypothetical protein M3P85_14575 [Actinomycetota bacterium]|nr:hypothetical protein [Actinomycetota bacterium]